MRPWSGPRPRGAPSPYSAWSLSDHLHAGNHAAERREALIVETATVVAEIDEHLAGARVGASHRVGDVAALVALPHWIVLDLRGTPRCRDLRIAVDAELHHEAGDHPEESHVVVEAVLDEIVEAIRALRRPLAGDLDHEHAFGGIELRLVNRRSLLAERRGTGQVADWLKAGVAKAASSNASGMSERRMVNELLDGSGSLRMFVPKTGSCFSGSCFRCRAFRRISSSGGPQPARARSPRRRRPCPRSDAPKWR